MKILRREFTPREKLLLLLLVIVVFGGLYYYFVDQPIRTELKAARDKQKSIQAEITESQKQQDAVQSMQNELDYVLNNQTVAVMGSYNNSSAELEELNKILHQTLKYDIIFTKSTLDDNLFRRYFTIKFTTETYQDAFSLLTELYHCTWRCLISDIKVSTVEKNKDLSDSKTEVSVNAIFYETLYGGSEDIGLPEKK